MTTYSAKVETHDVKERALVIILLGAPGSGKGTQSVEISHSFNLPHISTGDLFRENIKNQTEIGQKVKSYLDKGALVPDELVFDILFARISKADCSKGYILDGFPRTTLQAHKLEDLLSSSVHFAIFNLVVDDSAVIKRLSGRLVCKKCSRVFHKDSTPPKIEGVCDVCGEELYQRSDDNPEVIKERLRVYYEQTKPLEEYYKNKGQLTPINASGSPAEVLKTLKAKIQEMYPIL